MGLESNCVIAFSVLLVYSYLKKLGVGRRLHVRVEMVDVPLWKTMLHSHRKMMLVVRVKVVPLRYHYPPLTFCHLTPSMS